MVVAPGAGTGGGAGRGNSRGTSQGTAHLWQLLLFLELSLFCWLQHFCHMWLRVVFIVKNALKFIFPVFYFAFKIPFFFMVSDTNFEKVAWNKPKYSQECYPVMNVQLYYPLCKEWWFWWKNPAIRDDPVLDLFGMLNSICLGCKQSCLLMPSNKVTAIKFSLVFLNKNGKLTATFGMKSEIHSSLLSICWLDYWFEAPLASLIPSYLTVEKNQVRGSFSCCSSVAACCAVCVWCGKARRRGERAYRSPAACSAVYWV